LRGSQPKAKTGYFSLAYRKACIQKKWSNRATGTMGLSPAGLQPCRPLQIPVATKIFFKASHYNKLAYEGNNDPAKEKIIYCWFMFKNHLLFYYNNRHLIDQSLTIYTATNNS